MLWKWQTNKNSPFRGSQGRIIELMWHHQISITNSRAEQLFLLQCTLSVRLQLSHDLSASRIPEAPGPLPDAWVGAVPITVVLCRDLKCCSRNLLPTAELGDHGPECCDPHRDPRCLRSAPAISQVSFDLIGTWLLREYSFLFSVRGCCLTFFDFFNRGIL